LVPERNPNMWWLGLCPTHHTFGSLLRAKGIFITLLGWGPQGALSGQLAR